MDEPNKFTQVSVDRLLEIPPDKRARRYYDTDTRGFYLTFSKVGAPSYMLRYTGISGDKREMSLGEVELAPLTMAALPLARRSPTLRRFRSTLSRSRNRCARKRRSPSLKPAAILPKPSWRRWRTAAASSGASRKRAPEYLRPAGDRNRSHREADQAARHRSRPRHQGGHRRAQEAQRR